MGAVRNAPNSMVQRVAGWRASRIQDPVLRLRFLRRTVGDRRIWDLRTEHGRAWFRRRRTSLLAGSAILLLLPAGSVTGAGKFWKRGPIITAQASQTGPETYPQVWQVEQNTDYESYSNGLRIERRFEVSNEPRTFVVFSRGSEAAGPAEERTAPTGIVFHTTESMLADFDPGNSQKLVRIGDALLRFVHENRCYHYVVDRFGRVWRVVREQDTANHAGYSVWADARWTYVNVNRAFLGISVEAQTQPGGAKPEATPAQVHALRTLTEMLRSKYRISAVNCITHAQVSVNPDNMQAGYHYDWASNFPYAEVGLPNNYSIPAPSMWLFGFTYDGSLVNLTGEPFWKGLVLGEELLRQNATAHGMGVPAYRQALEKRYREVLSVLKSRDELSKEKRG